MKNLIKLQLRKSLLTFTVILGAVLAAVPLALAVKAREMSPREAINLAMFYWAAAGIPLTALILSGIAGAEAAKETARGVEHPLPVSQYRLLLSSLAAVLIELGVLILTVCAVLGFNLPLESVTKMQEQVLRFYLFTIAYLALYGFAFSYAFKNGIAGGMLAASAVTATLYPLVSMSVFQRIAFELVPLRLLNPAIAALALACGVLALKPLSAITDRNSERTVPRMSAIVLLLAAPVLAAAAVLFWLNLAGRNVTLPVTKIFPPFYGVDRHLYSARSREEAASLMLVQKPFSGEVFFIDKNGNRSIIAVVEKTGKLGPAYFLPDLSFAEGKTIAGPSGEIWVLYSLRGRSRVLSGSMKTGFTARADTGRIWTMNLIAGKEPGILDRREDGFYYSPLTAGKDGLEWKKVSSSKEGYLSFLGEKYCREGAAAVFAKDGRTLEYRGRRWTVPGALAGREPIPGIELADGMNFIVPAKTKDGYATYLCRPGGKTEAIWPGYFRLAHNISVTPDGALWGVDQVTIPGHGALGIKGTAPKFNILTAEGAALPEINTGQILELTGTDHWDLKLLRAKGGYLWFNAGDKYLVKADARTLSGIKLWRLPKGKKMNLVSPSSEGIFIAAADGVYFMDWEGGKKKIY